jgi:enamine deaminase RidA (YjgF/YER057c/UK114 family)
MATTDQYLQPRGAFVHAPLTDAERAEMRAVGVIDVSGLTTAPPPLPGDTSAVPRVEMPIARTPIEAPGVLNEAYDYAKPASFSRGLRFNIGDTSMLMISGTASVDEAGRTVHVGDFRAQLWRTYRNITELLAAEGATWHDIVRTTCYLRDIERDYRDFNEVRTAFFTWMGLGPLPASTAIQARICREDLLVEIEAIAIIPASRHRST